MMRYFENNDGDYITTFGIGEYCGEEISEERYNAIIKAVEQAPEDTETTTHRLKADLTWEQCEIEPVEPNIDDIEALDIILGGAE